MNTKCPFCDLDGCMIDSRTNGRDGSNYNVCNNCGQFILSGTLKTTVGGNTQKEKAIISHAIWKMQKEGKIPKIDTGKMESILKNAKLPNPAEQANNAILWLGMNSENLAAYQNIQCLHFSAKIGTYPDINSVIFILKELCDKKLIESAGNVNPQNLLSNKSNDAHMKFRLSFAGREKYEELKRGILDSKKAFMAMPFNGIFKEKAYNVFKLASQEAGFDLCNPLLDQPEAGLIDDRMRVEIRLAKFLVADLTGNNSGVYWEAGFAEGLGKKVIYTCERKFYDENKPHFDTNHLQTVIWEEEKVNEAAQDLKAVIRNTFPGDAKMED